MAAYECALAAKVLHHKATREDNAEALKLIDRSLALDPDYAHAHAWRGCILGQAWGYGWAADKDATFNEVKFELDRAIALDDNDADVHRILAAIAIVRNEMTQARYHQDRALALNPNYDLVVVQMGELFTWLGKANEGDRLDPPGNEAQPPPSAALLGPSRPGAFRRPAVRQGDRGFHAHGKPRRPAAWLSRRILRLARRHDGGGRTHRSPARARPRPRLDKFLATMHYAREQDLLHLKDGLQKAGY